MLRIFGEKYNSLSDEELITKIRENEQDAFEALFYRYLPLLRYLITKNSKSDNDKDDLLQDATISFYYATQMYDFHSSAFSSFLSLCVERSLKSTIKKAAAKKRIPDDMLVYLENDLSGEVKVISAEEEFFHKDASLDTANSIKNKLSDLELNVLISFLKTGSYDETAKELGLTKKSVDNALVRVRRKLST